MKILFFHRWVGVHAGGTETHLLELAKRFSALGHKVSILTREGRMLGDLDRGIRVIRINKNFFESEHSYDDIRVYVHTGLFMIKSLFALFSLKIKGERFDIISAHFATEAVIARIYRFFTKTPFIFILEGYTPLEAKAARYADARVAISNFEAGRYKQNHGLDSDVIYIGVDRQRFSGLNQTRLRDLRLKLRDSESKLIILTVCRLEPRKDIFTLINAAKLIIQDNKAIKFVIAGEGIIRSRIEKEIKESNLEANVCLAGFVTDEELPYYYAAADIFLLTTKEEWFGIVFLEAMAAGLPIISTNVDACPEVVDGCGLFFEKGAYDELAKRILSMAGNEDLRRDLSAKSLARVKQFDWDKQILLYEKAYKRVLDNNR